MLSLCFFDFSVGVGAFVIKLSNISSFFSMCSYTLKPANHHDLLESGLSIVLLYCSYALL